MDGPSYRQQTQKKWDMEWVNFEERNFIGVCLGKNKTVEMSDGFRSKS